MLWHYLIHRAARRGRAPTNNTPSPAHPAPRGRAGWSADRIVATIFLLAILGAAVVAVAVDRQPQDPEAPAGMP